MSCAKSSGGTGAGAGAAAGNPSSALELGSSSLTCSLKGELGKGSMISGGWTEKPTGESGVAIDGICASYGKRSKIEEEDREARK